MALFKSGFVTKTRNPYELQEWKFMWKQEREAILLKTNKKARKHDKQYQHE